MMPISTLGAVVVLAALPNRRCAKPTVPDTVSGDHRGRALQRLGHLDVGDRRLRGQSS